MLPQTQYLAPVDPDREQVVAEAPWEHVQSIVGHLMKETDDYPVRYRVEEFPTDEQLAEIGKTEA